MGWDGLRVLSTQRGVCGRRDRMGATSLSLWANSRCPYVPFPPPLFSPRKETEAWLGQAPSSFPVPSSKASEANWKDWELLGLFQRGTGGTWKNWAFLLLPRDERLEETPPPWGKDVAAPKGCGEKDLGLLEKRRCLFPPPSKPPNCCGLSFLAPVSQFLLHTHPDPELPLPFPHQQQSK